MIPVNGRVDGALGVFWGIDLVGVRKRRRGRDGMASVPMSLAAKR